LAFYWAAEFLLPLQVLTGWIGKLLANKSDQYSAMPSSSEKSAKQILSIFNYAHLMQNIPFKL
jgi:hypothetical protein